MKIIEVLISSILVADRQRKDLKNIEELAESIDRIGLLHPIILTSENRLVTGERRLQACKQLGLTTIEARLLNDLSYLEAKEIELEENIKRADLTWQEEASAICEYHDLRTEENEEWSVSDSGNAIGMSERIVTYRLLVGRELKKPDSRINSCDSLRQAINFANRLIQRAAEEELSRVESSITETDFELDTQEDEPVKVKALKPANKDIIQASFLEWVKTFKGRKFNFIHCDFPYGVGYHESDQSSHEIKEMYEDTEEVYFTLLKAFLQERDRFMLQTCHVMFWYSQKHREATRALFAELAPELKLNYMDLIWHKSDNKGILPDAERGPRYTYETALFISRGDRRIVRPKAASHSAPTSRASSVHVSQKPEPVLRHFFEMFVDDIGEVLDPTCGSGTALAAAESLGARRVFGIDIDEVNVRESRDLLNRQRHIEAARKEASEVEG